jgi:Gluconate 2-dehydrogenase subunit 3
MRRRVVLQWMGALVAAVRAPRGVQAQAALTPSHEGHLRALADVVLPQEIGTAGHDAVVASFVAWTREYRAGADMDHGYGVTRVRRLPASPAGHYAAQLEALDRDARARGRGFADLARDERRAIVEAAIGAAKVERLPARPDGGHVATDLMGFFFNSIDGNDLCYRAAIGRDTCRGLDGSSERPAPRRWGGR